MSPRTIYLGRLIGLWLLILSIAEMINKAAMLDTAAQIVDSPSLLFLSGGLTLVAGLAIVLAHNVWRGGVMPIVVTILGWALLIKGIALLVVPPAGSVGMLRASHYADPYPFYVAIALFLGLYLTVAGFAARHPGRDLKS
ncbi:MAG: hypothetical protein P4L90_27215 [Rhodopila sp.]|nr:hypothetical protein [Rhodopila sp.]